MDKKPIQILLVEDDPTDALFFEEALAQETSSRFEIVMAYRLSEAFIRLLERQFDVILLDLGLPDSQGLETFERVRRLAPDIAVVVLSGRLDEEVATMAVQAGAQDYLLKGEVGWAILARSIRYAIERQQAKLALQASEHRYRALIENSNDAVVLMTANSVVSYASPVMTRILGFAPDEMIGRNAFEFIHPDHIALIAELFGRILQHPRSPMYGEVRCRHKDGSWRWAAAICNNLLEDPNVGAIILNFHDVTEQRRAEERIRYQASLLQNVSDAIVATDLEFNITSWNHGAERLYGWQADEVIGKPLDEVFRTAYSADPDGPAAKQLWESGSRRGETTHTHKDGRLVTVIAAVSVIRDGDGHPIGSVAVNREVPTAPEAVQLVLVDEFAAGSVNGESEGC